MAFIERFYPDAYMDSAYSLPYEKWYEQGKRGIIFDIDNTLVPHGLPADDRAKELFKRLKEMGYATLVLSNNKEGRVESFAKEAGSDLKYIYKADKPLARGYIEAMQRLGTDKESTVFVGDQIFTDVWGAKRLGIFCVLTKPIDPREEIQIVLKRYLEKPIIESYKRRMKKQS